MEKRNAKYSAYERPGWSSIETERENAIISTQLLIILTVYLLIQDPPGLRYNHPGIIDIQFHLIYIARSTDLRCCKIAT